MAAIVLTWDLESLSVSVQTGSAGIHARLVQIHAIRPPVEMVRVFFSFDCPADKLLSFSIGATCIQTGTDQDEFSCRCIPGFVGRLCDISESFCFNSIQLFFIILIFLFQTRTIAWLIYVRMEVNALTVSIISIVNVRSCFVIRDRQEKSFFLF